MAFAEPLGLYARCPGCLEELRGVLLVLSLQINASAATKNWEWDGSTPEVDDFVVPLVRHFLRENAPSLDPARVWLTGYSTGGAASLTAALRYPDVFSTALSSQSCSFALTTAGRASAFDAPRPDGVDPGSVPARHLKAVTLAVGAQDSIISSQACVGALSDKLRSGNASAKALGSAAVQLVVYADLGHVIWHDVYPQAFGSLWRAEGHETALTWAVFLSVVIVAMVTMGFEKKWGPREQPLEELLADGEDLDSLDRVVITNRFVLQAQRSLYGVAIVMVILSHWLPHDLSGIQTPGWTQVLLGILAANHTTMGLVFVLTGYANAISARPTAVGAREAVLLAVHLAMAWPTLFGSGIAVYHRWTLLWLVFYKMLLSLLSALQVPAPAQIACSVAAAWPLSETPDALPRLWGPRAQGAPRPAPWDVTSLLFDDFFFWSLGHKAYWFAIYLAAHHYGPRLVQHLQANPDHLRVAMTPWRRCLAALLLLSAWLVQRSFELPFDPRLPPELGDWPGFFGSWRRSLANVALDLAQLALLVVAVGVGNTVLRMCGDSVLGTYITHAYVDPGLVGLVTSSSAFGSLGALPAVGGVLQLLIAFSFPVAYAMTVGRLCTWCFLAAARACQARCAGSQAPAGCQGAARGEESTMDDDEGQ